MWPHTLSTFPRSSSWAASCTPVLTEVQGHTLRQSRQSTSGWAMPGRTPWPRRRATGCVPAAGARARASRAASWTWTLWRGARRRCVYVLGGLLPERTWHSPWAVGCYEKWKAAQPGSRTSPSRLAWAAGGPLGGCPAARRMCEHWAMLAHTGAHAPTPRARRRPFDEWWLWPGTLWGPSQTPSARSSPTRRGTL